MTGLIVHTTPLGGLKLIERQATEDARGFFERMFCQKTLEKLLVGRTVLQVNRSITLRSGTVRGLHFQCAPFTETKIVSCLRGRVWDVAVDLRKGSPTFLHYHSVLLTEGNQSSYFIPDGFAHGFQTLVPDCELLYLHTAGYEADSESALNALDPRIGINWPKAITERSPRDEQHAWLEPDFQGIDLS